MMVHFRKAWTHCFWENSSQKEHGFYWFVVYVMHVYVIHVYLCWMVLKNINGMKWRCRNFQQHIRFISDSFTELHGWLTCYTKFKIKLKRVQIQQKNPQKFNHNANQQKPGKEEMHWSLCSSQAKFRSFRNNWYFSKSPNISWKRVARAWFFWALAYW